MPNWKMQKQPASHAVFCFTSPRLKAELSTVQSPTNGLAALIPWGMPNWKMQKQPASHAVFCFTSLRLKAELSTAQSTTKRKRPSEMNRKGVFCFSPPRSVNAPPK
jgi:hypothetical protein